LPGDVENDGNSISLVFCQELGNPRLEVGEGASGVGARGILRRSDDAAVTKRVLDGFNRVSGNGGYKR